MQLEAREEQQAKHETGLAWDIGLQANVGNADTTRGAHGELSAPYPEQSHVIRGNPQNCAFSLTWWAVVVREATPP